MKNAFSSYSDKNSGVTLDFTHAYACAHTHTLTHISLSLSVWKTHRLYFENTAQIKHFLLPPLLSPFPWHYHFLPELLEQLPTISLLLSLPPYCLCLGWSHVSLSNTGHCESERGQDNRHKLRLSCTSQGMWPPYFISTQQPRSLFKTKVRPCHSPAQRLLSSLVEEATVLPTAPRAFHDPAPRGLWLHLLLFSLLLFFSPKFLLFLESARHISASEPLPWGSCCLEGFVLLHYICMIYSLNPFHSLPSHVPSLARFYSTYNLHVFYITFIMFFCLLPSLSH